MQRFGHLCDGDVRSHSDLFRWGNLYRRDNLSGFDHMRRRINVRGVHHVRGDDDLRQRTDVP